MEKQKGAIRPRLELARRVLPAPLLKAIRHIFAQGIGDGAMLVGGTALSGFYAGHRRSDDIDLFTASPSHQRATVLAAQSLSQIGATVTVMAHSAQFYRARAEMDGLSFLVDVALHEYLHKKGKKMELKGGITVPELPALVALKAAALVSRAGEKDLYDILWVLKNVRGMTLETFVESALNMDGGADAEGLIVSVTGAPLNKESCGFAIGASKDKVFTELTRFRRGLLKGLDALASKKPAPPIAELLRRVKRLS